MSSKKIYIFTEYNKIKKYKKDHTKRNEKSMYS